MLCCIKKTVHVHPFAGNVCVCLHDNETQAEHLNLLTMLSA